MVYVHVLWGLMHIYVHDCAEVNVESLSQLISTLFLNGICMCLIIVYMCMYGDTCTHIYMNVNSRRQC